MTSDLVECERDLEKSQASLKFCHDTTEFKPRWYQNDLAIIGMMVIVLGSGIAIGDSLK